jgi:DNA-binding NarL/FixJ family response regulator
MSVSETVPNSPMRVFLLIESRLLREALERLLRKRSDLQVVGRGAQSEITPEQFKDLQADVVVIDCFHPQWLCAPSKHCDVLNGAKFLLLGMNDDPEQFLAAVKAGISGYLLKDASTSEVLAGVRAIYRGEAVCPPKLCLRLFQYVARMTRETKVQSNAPRPGLTIRQKQLVELVAQGLTNKEIAFRLNLSEFTVRNHIHRILKQVEVGSRTEAVEALIASGYSLKN